MNSNHKKHLFLGIYNYISGYAHVIPFPEFLPLCVSP